MVKYEHTSRVVDFSDPNLTDLEKMTGISQETADQYDRLEAEKIAKAKKIWEFMNALDIPYRFGVINGDELYDILTDEQKVKDLVSKLKLKAFW